VIGGFVRRVLGIDEPDLTEVEQQRDSSLASEAQPDPASGAFRWLREHRNEFADEEGWLAISEKGVIARGATCADVLAQIGRRRPTILVTHFSREPLIAF
jgi:hypothetical protein